MTQQRKKGELDPHLIEKVRAAMAKTGTVPLPAGHGVYFNELRQGLGELS